MSRFRPSLVDFALSLAASVLVQALSECIFVSPCIAVSTCEEMTPC